jgi:hypothetical protein
VIETVVQWMQMVTDNFRRQGYRFVTVGECLGEPDASQSMVSPTLDRLSIYAHFSDCFCHHHADSKPQPVEAGGKGKLENNGYRTVGSSDRQQKLSGCGVLVFAPTINCFHR